MKIALIIDPDIFFHAYHGEYQLHPVIRHWIDAIKENKQIEELHFYLLCDTPGWPSFKIYSENTIFELPIGPFFFNILSPEAFNFTTSLWQGKLQFADKSVDSLKGVSHFSDDFQPSKDEMIVITASAEVSSFFKVRDITVAELNPPCYLITKVDFDEIVSEEGVEIYCDFDGTLFDVDNLLLLLALSNATDDSSIESVRNNLQQMMSQNDDLKLTNKNTIRFLSKLTKHPMHLLTQRTRAIDNSQSSYNSALSMVDYINKQHDLEIKSSEESFLNASLQLSEESGSKNGPKRYIKKIEHIYGQLKERTKENRPKSVVLIDDDLVEHAKVEMAQSHFEGINVKVTSVLVANPVYFSRSFMEAFKQHASSLHVELDKLYSSEMGKLSCALAYVRERQLAKVAVDETDKTDQQEMANKEDKQAEVYDVDNRNLLFYPETLLDEAEDDRNDYGIPCTLF